MGARGVCIRRPAYHHPAGDSPRIEAQLLQQREEHLVQFIAITAPPLEQDFFLDPGQIKGHRQLRQNREVFESEGRDMAQLQLRQGLQRGRWRGVISQALQVQAAVGQARRFLGHGAILGREAKGFTNTLNRGRCQYRSGATERRNAAQTF